MQVTDRCGSVEIRFDEPRSCRTAAVSQFVHDGPAGETLLDGVDTPFEFSDVEYRRKRERGSSDR